MQLDKASPCVAVST